MSLDYPSNIKLTTTIPASIFPVPTAIPLFIGYTETANLHNAICDFQPVLIDSEEAFTAIFGKSLATEFEIEPDTQGNVRPFLPHNRFECDETPVILKAASAIYRLYSGIQHYFRNAGGPCYVISVGRFDTSVNALTDTAPFLRAIKAAESVQEPTLLLIPDAVSLHDPNGTTAFAYYRPCFELQTAMKRHCELSKNRIALLDIPGLHFVEDENAFTKAIKLFREESPISPADAFAAAYAPWIVTNSYTFASITPDYFHASLLDTIRNHYTSLEAQDSQTASHLDALRCEYRGTATQNAAHAFFLKDNWYKELLQHIADILNTQPPSAAIAGTFVFNDRLKGVHTPPANNGFNTVSGVSFDISEKLQTDLLNNPKAGTHIGAIRNFSGKGLLVWGARTLAHLPSTARYLQVARTSIFIRSSILQFLSLSETGNYSSAFRAQLIHEFLNGLWQEGILKGANPHDAFSVEILSAEPDLSPEKTFAIHVSLTHASEPVQIDLSPGITEKINTPTH